MPENQSTSPNNSAWDQFPDFDASARAAGEIYGREDTGAKSTALTRPISYPPYIAISAVGGLAIAVAGFVLSLVYGAVWPVLVLVCGLSILWFSSWAARRAERRGKQININTWDHIQWTATQSQSLPQQAGQTSPTA